jgi:hypothetical protein
MVKTTRFGLYIRLALDTDVRILMYVRLWVLSVSAQAFRDEITKRLITVDAYTSPWFPRLQQQAVQRSTDAIRRISRLFPKVYPPLALERYRCNCKQNSTQLAV